MKTLSMCAFSVFALCFVIVFLAGPGVKSIGTRYLTKQEIKKYYLTIEHAKSYNISLSNLTKKNDNLLKKIDSISQLENDSLETLVLESRKDSLKSLNHNLSSLMLNCSKEKQALENGVVFTKLGTIAFWVLKIVGIIIIIGIIVFAVVSFATNM